MQFSLSLAAYDLEITYDYYRQIPGLSLHWLTDSRGSRNSLVLCVGNIKLLFQPLDQLEQQHPTLFQHLGRTLLGSGILLEFECPDLDPVYQVARNQHWPILYELDDREHQRRELWTQDPNGYLIVMNEEPPPAP
ncbi:MAG: hypothetical protein R6V33_09760 [Pelovirga sp.]